MFSLSCSMLTRDNCKIITQMAYQTPGCVVTYCITMILRKSFITVSGNICDLHKLIPSNLENSIVEFLL